MANKDKFTWNEGDVTVKLSQCSNCIFNSSIIGCKKYGTKPDQYALNETECPEKEQE